MGYELTKEGQGAWGQGPASNAQANALVRDLLHEVQKTSERVATVEKTVVEMGKARSDATDVLKKVIGDGRGGAAMTVGFEGGDTLGLIRLMNPPRRKGIGWGPFLSKVAQAGQNHNVAQAERELEAMGSVPIQKAPLAEAAGATGGYTVPIQFYAELQRMVAEDSFIRQRCTTVPMTSYTCQVPALNMTGVPAAGTSAFFGGLSATWIAEAAAKPESEPTFDQITLTARDLAFHTVISNNLLMDNAVGLDTILVTLFREAMAWFYDYYILRGSGTGQPVGVLGAPGTLAIGRTTIGPPARFTLLDAAHLWEHLPVQSQGSAIWVAHQSVFSELVAQTSATTGGSLVWLNPSPPDNGGPLATSPPMTLFGRPLYFTEKVPKLGTKGDVNLIDASKYLVGDRMAVQIEASPHVKFLTNQLVWRIVARWDGAPWLKLPITLADGAYKVSPFVTLDSTVYVP